MPHDLESGLMAHQCISLTDLYLHIKFHLNRRVFCGWTYGRTYGQTHRGRLY